MKFGVELDSKHAQMLLIKHSLQVKSYNYNSDSNI
jgi:hypothetical protein